MKNFLNKNWVRLIMIGLSILANVLFYTISAPESGAMAAVEVHPLFYYMIQQVGLAFIAGQIVMLWKKW